MLFLELTSWGERFAVGWGGRLSSALFKTRRLK
jgi:hypothetical protein